MGSVPGDRRLGAGLAFVGVFAVFFGLGNLEPSWDVLERSWVLEHWDQAPPSHRFFRTHVLELPLARPFHLVFASDADPTGGLRALSSACAAFLAALTYAWARKGGRGGAFAFAMVALQLSAFGVWQLGSGGEEKMLGATLLVAAVGAYAWMREHGRPARPAWQPVCVGLVCGAAVLCHFTNAVLLAALLVAMLVALVPGFVDDRRQSMRELILLGTAAAVVVVGGYGLCARAWFPDHPEPGVAVLEVLVRYHRAPASSPSGATGWAAVVEGWGTTTASGLGGAVLFLGVGATAFGLAVRRFRRDATHRPTIAMGVAAALVWVLHFTAFEPWNPESWLAIWLAATCTIAACAPFGHGRERSVVVVALVVSGTIVALACPRYASYREGRPRTWAHRMEAICMPGAFVVVASGLEARALRIYAPALFTVGADELYGGVDPYIGRAPTTPAELNAHLREGGVVCLSEATARGLTGIRIAARPLGNLAGSRILQLVEPLRPIHPSQSRQAPSSRF